MPGITNTGFELKRLSDILDDMASALASVQDPITGETLTPDLADENDPLIQHVNAIADSLSVCWEQLQLAYNQFDPLKATGAGLSGLVQLNGLRRRPGQPSVVTLTISGTPGKTLLEGRQVTDMNNSHVFILPLVAIPGGGTVNVEATCNENGPFEAGPGTLVNILTPVSGWDSVTNANAATPGTYEETDTALRSRQQVSTSATAQTIIEAISSGIANLIGVTFVRVYQNIQLTTDGRNIPAKTIAAIVMGGDEDEIANILYEKVAAGGCDTFGDVEVSIFDSLGIEYVQRFSRPTVVDIYVAVDITVVDVAAFPSDGADRIIAAIIAWATSGASSVGDLTVFDQTGFYPGRSVYATELLVPAYGVPGMKVNSVVVGITSSPAAQQVVIDWNEIASFDPANIDVAVS